jgi:hypothetical protein
VIGIMVSSLIMNMDRFLLSSTSFRKKNGLLVRLVKFRNEFGPGTGRT